MEGFLTWGGGIELYTRNLNDKIIQVLPINMKTLKICIYLKIKYLGITSNNTLVNDKEFPPVIF